MKINITDIDKSTGKAKVEYDEEGLQMLVQVAINQILKEAIDKYKKEMETHEDQTNATSTTNDDALVDHDVNTCDLCREHGWLWLPDGQGGYSHFDHQSQYAIDYRHRVGKSKTNE